MPVRTQRRRPVDIGRLGIIMTLAMAPFGPARAGSPENSANLTIEGHILEPAELPSPDLSALKVPAGFRIDKFAENLGNARMLAVAPDGRIYVTRREEGDVLMLKDGGNGRAAGAAVRVASRSGIHGIAFHDGQVYLATVKEIFRAPVLSDGRFGPLKMLIHDLPDGGQHNTRTVQIGPDGMMYISVASTCNECLDTNPESATMIRAMPDGTSRAVFASGLRDTVGWGWHPQTGELWGMDHGIDWLGDEFPPEELNRIEKGKRYGWPYVWGNNQPNPHQHPPGGLERSEWLAKSTPPVLGYTAHASPMQMSFYTGAQFPESYRGDAFVSMRGSWNRKPPSGYEIVRIHFKGGQPVSFEPFVTGFASAKGQSGRPCGNVVAKDGSLLFSDDRNGVIYRVSYAGTANGPAAPSAMPAPPSTPPAGPMVEQAARGSGVPLAMARPETKAKTAEHLKVTSSAFNNGGMIPAVYSDYEQGASFPLAWTAGPVGTQSYVLVMEDPDVKHPPIPMVHWVAWNIPASVTGLRDGLQKQDRLEDPPGLRQGPGSGGTVGYRGPRPPAGDAPHHYHVQIFALDRQLDLLAGANRDEVLAALKGHVLAGGELVGRLARPDHPAKP